MRRNPDHEGYTHLFSQSSVSENPSILEYNAEMIGKCLPSPDFNVSIFTVKENKKSPNRYRFI
jgi:hypothetical protein